MSAAQTSDVDCWIVGAIRGLQEDDLLDQGQPFPSHHMSPKFSFSSTSDFVICIFCPLPLRQMLASEDMDKKMSRLARQQRIQNYQISQATVALVAINANGKQKKQSYDGSWKKGFILRYKNYHTITVFTLSTRQRCKNWQMRQTYLCYFFLLVLIFGLFWVIFGPFWQFWVIFGLFWVILGHFWAIFWC